MSRAKQTAMKGRWGRAYRSPRERGVVVRAEKKRRKRKADKRRGKETGGEQIAKHEAGVQSTQLISSGFIAILG